MRLARQGSNLMVSEILDLNSSTTAELGHAIHSAFPCAGGLVEIDLSGMGHLDCSGLGTLIALSKSLVGGKGPACRLGLRNASPSMRRLLDLTRTEQIFQVT